jgi:hypothetical protein
VSNIFYLNVNLQVFQADIKPNSQRSTNSYPKPTLPILHHYLSLKMPSATQTSFTYASIVDYSALPSLRQFCADGLTQFEVTNLPVNPLINPTDLYVEAHRQSCTHSALSKAQIRSSQPPVASSLSVFVTATHALAIQIFKNLSHVLELPWERYLEEMHEFGAPSDDTLRLEKHSPNSGIKPVWSTLTLVFSETKPESCLVRFGEALSIFSQGFIKAGKGPIRYPGLGVESRMSELRVYGEDTSDDSKLTLLYEVRPNHGVFYTQMAGALMDALTAADIKSRKRVEDLGLC